VSLSLDDSREEEPAFLLRFLGVRGSFPVPGPEVVYFGGNTSCIEVVSGPFRVAFDCGTGIISMGNELAARAATAPPRVLVLVTHVHHDHTMGWPFFKPVYDSRSRIWLMGPGRDGLEFRSLFEKAFSDPYFPVPPEKMGSAREFRTLQHGAALAWRDADEAPVALDGDPGDALVIRAFLNLNHPNGGVLNYRLDRRGRSIFLATDVEGSSCEGGGDVAEHAAGADVLIHDAQYTDEEYPKHTLGWGHSTWGMAVDVAQRAKARRLVLYHHDPAHDDATVEDIERQARRRFARTISACEGLEIRV
jgi:phosphoribosyl 1,2-cyclic phosphodiesterase